MFYHEIYMKKYIYYKRLVRPRELYWAYSVQFYDAISVGIYVNYKRQRKSLMLFLDANPRC